MDVPVTIIGGGLSGLLVGYRLAQKGIEFKVVEANQRLGGRILSKTTANGDSDQVSHPAIDLGPSWFWPGQKHISRLIQELEMSEFVYSQTGSGAAVIEYADGTVEKRQGGGSMVGSYRLTGGMYHLIQKLINGIKADAFLTNTRVTHIKRISTGTTIVGSCNGDSTSINSEHVVLAVPPRVVADTIEFIPGLSGDYLARLKSVPTWMAGQAKFVAVYNEAFWLKDGLSGDGMSQRGPLVEIHDASPKAGGPFALFGFVGVPAAQRLNHGKEIQSAAVAQLARMFGEKAKKPVSTHFKDWAFDSLTATELDLDGPGMHASAGQDLITIPEYGVFWAGTETAVDLNHSNGYLEGAVEAGERAATLLHERLSDPKLKVASDGN